MPSYRRVRIGLLGLGKMGAFHAKILSSLPGVSFKGAFDADQNQLAAASAALGIKPFPSLEALLEKVEAVVIATPTPTHLSLGRLCLNAGKPVFMEKPLAASAEAAGQLVALAEKKHLILGVGHIERQNPAFRGLEAAMHKELLLAVEARRQSPFPERMAKESVVFDMLIHDLDLILHLAKSEPKEVTILNKKGTPACLDQVEAQIFWASGLVAKVLGNRLHREKERTLLAICEEHDFEADLLHKTLKRSVHQPPETTHPLEAAKMEEVPVKSYDQLTRELQLFVFSIRRGKYLCVSGAEALQTVILAEEIERLAAC